jgi:ABC-2 type transport system permease protein
MAGVANLGLATQLSLMAGLRWRIFINSMRTKTARLDFLAYVFAGLFGAVFAIGGGIGLGIGAYFIATRGRFTILSLLLWGVFFVWQFMPLILATSGTGFDFRNLLRFPLRFSAFYLLSLGFGLADPAAMIALFWLICITLGITLARADLFLPAVLLLLSFATLNLLLNRMLFSWLERLLARRRSREALWAVFMLCILGMQFSGMIVQRVGPRSAQIVIKALPMASFLPPGLPGRALGELAQGGHAALLSSTGLLLAYAALCGMLLRFRLRRQYQGEDLGETQAPAVPQQVLARVRRAPAHLAAPSAVAKKPSFLGALIPGPAIAMLQKELRYLIRNTMLMMNLVLPLFFVVLISYSAGNPRHAGDNPFFNKFAEFGFPGGVAYMFLIVGQMANNSFAYDGRGVQLLYLAPVGFRDVLLGKNLMTVIELAFETVAVWILVSVLRQPPRLNYVGATLCWLLFALVVHLIVGNWLSLQFPRRFDFGQYRRRASGVSVLVGLGLQAGLLGLGALVGFLSFLAGGLWIFSVVFLALSGLALWLYFLTLDYYTKFAVARQETLTAQIVR